MNNQRRIVVLPRWAMFAALAYLLWGTGSVGSAGGIGLLAVFAGTNLVLTFVRPGRWEHPALLPSIVLLDAGALAASLFVGGTLLAPALGMVRAIGVVVDLPGEESLVAGEATRDGVIAVGHE